MPTTRLRFVVLLAAVLFYVPVFAQIPPDCGGPPSNVLPAESCPEVCVYCDFSGYMGSTAGYFGNNHPGGGFCGQVQNDQWLGFIAGATSATFTVQPSNCLDGNGIQAALYDNCSYGPLLACTEGGAGQGEMSAQFTVALLPGKAYYLMIDGFSGDQCDIQVSVVPPSAVQAPPVGATGQIQGPKTSCPGATVTYSVPATAGAGGYIWSSTNPSVLFNGELGPIEFDAPNGNLVQVSFPSDLQGQVTLCVQPLNACLMGQQKCTAITVAPIPPTILPSVTVLASDLPYQLPWGDAALNTGTYQTTLTSWLGCDSIVRQSVTVLNPQATGIVFWDVDSNGTYDSGEPLASGVKVVTQTGQMFAANNLGELFFVNLTLNDTLRVMTPSPNVTVTPAFHVYKGPVGFFSFALSVPARGLVFWDANNNGIFDPGEARVANAKITTQTGKTFTANNLGEALFLAVATGDTLRATLPLPGSASNPAFHLYTGTFQNFQFALTAPSTALVFWDINKSGLLDAGEPLASGVSITTQNGKTFFTNNLGEALLSGLKLDDTLRALPPVVGATSSPDFRVYSGVPGAFQFVLSAPASVLRDVSVDLTNTNVFRQGFTTHLVVTVRNEGVLALASNTVAQVLLPYPLEYLSAVPGLTAKIGDTLLWSLGALPAGAVRTITLQVRTRLGTANNTPLSLLAWSRPFSGEAKANNNYAPLEAATVGSYDPNDKQVRPKHVTPAMLADGLPFQYTVRFQNTGNFPADFVRVVDVLADDLDVASMRLLASSHACTWSFSAPNTVEFFFENIQLPDSVSNEPESHGFVKFSVLPRKGLLLGTAVENFCDIYFDFNDPVRTNTIGTQVVAFLPGNTPADTDELLVRPNPAAFRAFCEWGTPAPAPGTLRLFNIWGLPVHEVQVEPGSTEGVLEVMGLPPGVYVVWLEAGGLRLVKTLVVQSSWMEWFDP